MPARNLRLVFITFLVSSLGACSALSSKQASEPSARPSAQVETAPAASAAPASEPAAAPANPKIVVIVEGRRSAAVSKQVERLLAAQYEVVPSTRYRKTARRLKARKMAPRHVARVAAKIGADVVLHGVLDRRKNKRRRGRFELSVMLRDGTTGKVVERFTVPLGSRRLRKRDQNQLASKIMPALDNLGPSQLADEPEPRLTLTAERRDDSGQVVDDEIPATLR